MQGLLEAYYTYQSLATTLTGGGPVGKRGIILKKKKCTCIDIRTGHYGHYYSERKNKSAVAVRGGHF